MSGGLNLRLIYRLTTVLIIGLILVSLTCLSQPQVEPLKQELSLSPPGVLTAPFRVKNSSDLKQSFGLTLELPAGWSVVNLPSEATIQPQSSKFILASFRVPGSFRAGNYPATLLVKEQKEDSTAGKAKVMVTVEAKISLSLVVSTESGGAIPGESVEYEVLVKNRGNVQTKFKLRESSTWPVKLPTKELTLKPSEERKVRITHVIPPDATPGTFESLYLEVYTPAQEDVKQSTRFMTETFPPPPNRIKKDLGLPVKANFQWTESFDDRGGRDSQLSIVGSGVQSRSSVAFSFSGVNLLEDNRLLENIYLEHSAPGYSLELGNVTKSPGTFISASGRGLSLNVKQKNLFDAEFFYLPNQNGSDEGLKLELHGDSLNGTFSWANLDKANQNYSLYELTVNAPTRSGGALSGNYSSNLESRGSYSSLSYRWSGNNFGGDLAISYTDPPFLGNSNSEFDLSISTGFSSTVLDLWGSLTEEYTWKSSSELEQGQVEVGGRYIIDRYTRFSLELIASWKQGNLNGNVESLTQEMNFKFDQYWQGNSFSFQSSLKKEVDRVVDSDEWTVDLSARWGPDLQDLSLNFFSGFQKTFSSTIISSGTFTGGLEFGDRSSAYRPSLSVSLSRENGELDLTSRLELEPTSDSSLVISAETNGTEPEYSASVYKDFSLTYPWLKVKGQLNGTVFVDANGNGIRESNERTPEGILLSLDGTQAVTGKNGGYRFVPSDPGQYELEFINLPPGFVPLVDLPRTISLKKGERKTLNIPIVKASSVAGTLIKAESPGENKPSWVIDGKEHVRGGEGIEDVQVQISTGKRTFKTTTNGEGAFRFNGLRPGDWTVSVKTEDLPSLYYLKGEEPEIKLEPGEEKVVLIRAFKEERDIQELELGDEELELGDED